MDWDQWLFQKSIQGWRKIKARFGGRAGQEANNAFSLKGAGPGLQYFMCGLTGARTEIYPAEEYGALGPGKIFLPEVVNVFSDRDLNRDLFLLRTCLLVWSDQANNRRELIRLYDRLTAWRSELIALNAKGTGVGREQLRTGEYVTNKFLATLRGTWPAISQRFGHLGREWASELAGRLGSQEARGGRRKILSDRLDEFIAFFRPPEQNDNSPGETNTGSAAREHERAGKEAPENKIETELDAPARESVQSLSVDHEKVKDYTLLHNFEKIETLDEFSGKWRDPEGADELEDHAEALEELDLRHTVRWDQPTHSVYKMDFAGAENQAVVADPDNVETIPGERVFFYPEWNYRQKQYKTDYCRLFEGPARVNRSDEVSRILKEHDRTRRKIGHKLRRIQTESEHMPNLSDGTDIMLDQVIENFALIRGGHSPREKVYTRPVRHHRDVSVLFLLDISLSTDGFFEDRRIIETARESLALVSQVLWEAGEDFALAAFYSRTRNYCHFRMVKDFRQSWPVRQGYLAGLEPVGYTRIGPVLRHAGEILEARPGRRKCLFLISDGKPNDYDRYEGRYGIEDVRKALSENRKRGILSYALTLDGEARRYLPFMFGVGNFKLLRHPGQMPEALFYFYQRLLRG